MKRMLFPILMLFLLVACEKDQVVSIENNEALTTNLEFRNSDPIGDLITHIEEDLNLPIGPEKSILVQLRNIQMKLDRGQTEEALAMLEGLITHLEGLAADGTVDASVIADLIDDVEWIRCEVDPECENEELLEVWIDNPDGDPTTNDGYTLYVHPYDQRTGSPQSNGIQWGGYGTDIDDCVGLGDLPNYAPVPYGPYPYWGAARDAALTDFDGELNTQKITCALGDGDYAAKVCADLSGEEGLGYDDWYLPSLGELNAIYEQLFVEQGGQWLPEEERNLVNNFNGDYYWSSSESAAYVAWGQNFTFGNQDDFIKYVDFYSCRCVRR